MTMNLSGSLDAFRLDEVMSLLGMGGRTARLQVSAPTGVGVVHLTEGEVSSATADCARAGLLRQLVTTAAVPPSDLASALETDQPVRALVDSGVVDADLARGVAAEHAVDALGEMLAWTEGEFAVWVGEDDPADIGVRYPVHELVERGRERLGQWEHLHAALPANESVLSVVAEQAEPPNLAVDEWAVLARVDGRRTLAEVVAAAGCAPLVASDRLVGLIGRGLVRVQDPQVEAEPDEVGRLLDAFEGQTRPEELVDEVEELAPSMLEASLLLGRVEGEPSDAVAPADEPVEFGPVGFDEPAELGEAPSIESQVAVEEPPASDDQPVGFEEPVAVEVDPVGVEPVEVEPVEAEPVEAEPVNEPALDEQVEAEPVEAEPVNEPALDERIDVEPVAFAEPVAVFEPVAFAESAEMLEPVALTEPVEVVEQLTDVASVPDVAPADPVGFELPGPASDVVATAGVPAAPIAPAVEWSPWAQALGLAAPAPAGELVVDPLAGRGIAQLIADAAGLQEVEHVPVPLAPLSLGAEDWSAADQDLDEQLPAPVVHDLEAPVPGPRAPGDAEMAQSALPQAEVAQAEEAAQEASDPLAGGLLAQLISGVRGL